MEFAFELALCAALEADEEWVLGRQLGAAVAAPGARVMDVVGVVPGERFGERAAVTDGTIPPPAIEADVPGGEAVPAAEAFDAGPERARELATAAADAGFVETERRGGRVTVRRTVDYPEGWFDRLVAIENKPGLDAPGDLRRQLRFDAALGLFDEVWLATASHVTGAHLNRIPETVGVWRVDPETGDRTVVREAAALAPDEPGVEPGDRHPLRREVAVVDAEAKARKRRRIAERAYGKGWRPTPPACAHARVTDDGRPECEAFDRVVDPGRDCADCAAREPGDRPADDADLAALRTAHTPWVHDPEGRARRQSSLDRFG
ncbi:MAG: DUF5787 family protein [Halolamina sp.]